MRKSTTSDTEVSDVTLADFVLPELVTAFCQAYQPLDEWQDGCTILTYSTLRAMFKAVPVTLGDPFIIYKQLLSEHGFYFHVDVATGEFVIYAMCKY